MQHHGESLRKLWSSGEFADFLENFLDSKVISSKERCGLLFARKLTKSVATMNEGDHGQLTAAGYSDEEILHLVQITSYFNFVNRMAEGLGVKMEGENHFSIDLSND